ncbi:hypothetical protein [Lysobacter enzymogenes]|uniref:hypothetical protein n=1 Tax=Lysobacter enzymogenes TaxID=69 RepID=UPI0011162611|nr:hypothetical protein [Lysobacter enzymogenes]UZW60544.1 hypothetical protein BV903_025400 [Lysobacter enzymogenes]
MLGRALAAEAEKIKGDSFRPVEIALVSGGRTAYVHSESAAEASGLADFADGRIVFAGQLRARSSMKNTKRNQPRRAARTPRQAASLRDSLEAKLLKVCADIGWICGWRDERLEPAPTECRSSRKRVMLGHALMADAKTREAEAFRPVDVALVSSVRTAHIQSESAIEVRGLADITYDLQDELARLGRMDSALAPSSEHSGMRGRVPSADNDRSSCDRWCRLGPKKAPLPGPFLCASLT